MLPCQEKPTQDSEAELKQPIGAFGERFAVDPSYLKDQEQLSQHIG